MAAFAYLLSAFAFAAFLARHVLSCALSFFPGSGWLWRASFVFGYDLLPGLSLLRDQLGLDAIAIFAVLAAMIIASVSRDLFVSVATLHLAALATGYCLASSAGYFPVATGNFHLFGLGAALGNLNPLQTLHLGLLVACVHGHACYLKALRGKALSGRASRL